MKKCCVCSGHMKILKTGIEVIDLGTRQYRHGDLYYCSCGQLSLFGIARDAISWSPEYTKSDNFYGIYIGHSNIETDSLGYFNIPDPVYSLSTSMKSFIADYYPDILPLAEKHFTFEESR